MAFTITCFAYNRIFIFIKIVEHDRGMVTYRARPSHKFKVGLPLMGTKRSNLPFEAEFTRFHDTLLVLVVELNR